MSKATKIETTGITINCGRIGLEADTGQPWVRITAAVPRGEGLKITPSMVDDLIEALAEYNRWLRRN